MEPPPGYFATVPKVESIEPTDDPATYNLTLREEATGRAEVFVMTVVEGDIPLVTWDRDLSYRWPGARPRCVRSSRRSYRRTADGKGRYPHGSGSRPR